MDLSLLEREAFEELEKTETLQSLEEYVIRFLGRKEGKLNLVLKGLGSLSPEEKKSVGQKANEIRSNLEAKISEKRKVFQSALLNEKLSTEKIDLTLPGTPLLRGNLHPILQTISDISHIFHKIGFDVVEGPEVETDYNNFTGLNIPENHSARDMHDTFYLQEKDADGKNYLLRTHTSPVQIRLMKASKPPIRIIAPGRVFRHEAVDATHAALFHQIEGLAIDQGLNFADLKGTLALFAKEFFGADRNVRFRPSYFPFVEPGAEMDVECFSCFGKKVTPEGKPCGICKQSGWLEVLGAGMVHPQVLRNVGLDPETWTGFAFGMGIERIVMTKYQIKDIRAFLESDVRFLGQFK